MIQRILAFSVACLLPAAGFAQQLTGIKVEPAEIKAGESARITVSFDVPSGINCGLRLHFGEGAPGDYKINQQKDVPLVVNRVYPRPGEYRLMVEPKTVGALLRCGGKSQYAVVKVAGTAAVAAPKPAAAAAPLCPAGWTLDRKSPRKDTGAFTCTAAPGTQPVKIACPGDLSYFENVRKGLLGCTS